MGEIKCSDHALMMQHISESPERFKTILESKEKVHNLEQWVGKIEVKIDKLPDILNGFYLRIMFSLGGLNIVMAIILNYLK
jgi:hypothetical protein